MPHHYWAYYNEFDREKAAWLRELMRRGVIADGFVDERSVCDVKGEDVADFTQCHWFAGIGIWSYALRLAGWGDERAIWTASCPCQPFSAAGKRKAQKDSRHLAPELIRLVEACRPGVVIGEQVASADVIGKIGRKAQAGGGTVWIDDVLADLERARYTTGAVIAPACGFGAPHIRQRLYWAARLADTEREQRQRGRAGEAGGEPGAVERVERLRDAGGLEHDAGDGREQRRAEPSRGSAAGGCGPVRVGDGSIAGPLPGAHGRVHRGEDGARPRDAEPQRPGPTNGYWAGADWVLTRPQRVGDPPSLRPVEPALKCVPYGTTTTVGFGSVGSGSKNESREEGQASDQTKEGKTLNETSGQTDTGKIMRCLPGQTGTQANREAPGRLGGVYATEVLQPPLYGAWHEQDIVPIPFLLTGESAPSGQTQLRSLWEDWSFASPPYRPEPIEQYPEEFANFVRRLPSASALAELRGDTTTAEVLQSMLAPLDEKWAVLHAHLTAEEVWRSIPEENQNRIVLGFNTCGWVSEAVFPLVNGAPARVGRLRGYGDGIVAAQAAAFIKAFREEIDEIDEIEESD